MASTKKVTVAVIGAGLSGVTAVKCALEEGLEPTCFEQDDQIGGIWYYTDNVRPNQGAGAYEELISNDGKEVMAFSDYPMPEQYSMNISWQQYQQYLKDYAQHFGVTQHIQFNTTVTKVKPAEDYSTTGRWEIHVQKKESPITTVHMFDKVIFATGPFRKAVMPNIPGMKDFKGQMIHAKDFRMKSIFKNKRVIILGDGTFAGEIASFSGAVAKKTYLVVRSDGGLFLFPRRALQGNWAFSMGVSRHFMLHTKWEDNIPMFMQMAKQYLDVDKYDMAPKLPLGRGGRISVADHLPDQIKEGKVIPKRGLRRFTENGAVLEDGSEIHDIDLVVLATGFIYEFDILDVPGFKGARRKQDLDLYLWEFPLNLPHHSLAILNLGTWINPYAIIGELQSRLACRVFNGKHRLPSKVSMEKWIKETRKFFTEKAAGKFMVMPVIAPEEIAKELGVAPSFWRLFWRSPIMAHKVHYGPNLPIVYRLVGPGAHKSAWKEYDKWYRRGFADSIPPPIPWGIHHYTLLSVVLGCTCTAALFLWMRFK